MTYDVTGHPMLTDGAEELGPTELAKHAEAAELLLKISSLDIVVFTEGSERYRHAQTAVALQVSYQVATGIEAFMLSSLTRARRTLNFRKGQRNMSVTHPMAKKIANSLRRGATATVIT